MTTTSENIVILDMMTGEKLAGPFDVLTPDVIRQACDFEHEGVPGRTVAIQLPFGGYIWVIDIPLDGKSWSVVR